MQATPTILLQEIKCGIWVAQSGIFPFWLEDIEGIQVNIYWKVITVSLVKDESVFKFSLEQDPGPLVFKVEEVRKANAEFFHEFTYSILGPLLGHDVYMVIHKAKRKNIYERRANASEGGIFRIFSDQCGRAVLIVKFVQGMDEPHAISVVHKNISLIDAPIVNMHDLTDFDKRSVR